MKQNVIERFTPRHEVAKRANDSGGECSNYLVGMGQKFDTPSLAGAPSLAPCTDCIAPLPQPEQIKCAGTGNNAPVGCENDMPGCKLVLDKKGVNQAFTNFIEDGGRAGRAGSSQLGLLFNQPETKRVNAAVRTTGVNEPDWTSPSQKLVGPPNPKFLIPPVVPAPSLDIDFWKTNNLVVRSGINATTPFDEEASGYAPTNPGCKGENKGMIASGCYQLPNTKLCPSDPMPIIEPPKGFQYIPKYEENEEENEEENGMGENGMGKNGMGENGMGENGEDLIEGFSIQPGSEPADIKAGVQFLSENKSLIGKEKQRILEGNCETCDELIDDHCVLINNGYHKGNLKVGLPTNFAASECGKSPALTVFNTDLFTSTVVPGIYQNSQIIEPINSNIGISFTQQIPPTTLSEQDGELLFEQHDPNLYQPPEPELPDQSPNASNVTDPRFTGYGASNRAYHEHMTGQTRFYYKDVDAIRMPNYISRSKVDCNTWADKYGPAPEGFEHGNPNTHNIHELANNAFRDATIAQRTSLMQSLMRKRNAELYQQRLFPLSNDQGAIGGNHR
jgi:hypothetical protein